MDEQHKDDYSVRRLNLAKSPVHATCMICQTPLGIDDSTTTSSHHCSSIPSRLEEQKQANSDDSRDVKQLILLRELSSDLQDARKRKWAPPLSTAVHTVSRMASRVGSLHSLLSLGNAPMQVNSNNDQRKNSTIPNTIMMQTNLNGNNNRKDSIGNITHSQVDDNFLIDSSSDMTQAAIRLRSAFHSLNQQLKSLQQTNNSIGDSQQTNNNNHMPDGRQIPYIKNEYAINNPTSKNIVANSTHTKSHLNSPDFNSINVTHQHQNELIGDCVWKDNVEATSSEDLHYEESSANKNTLDDPLKIEELPSKANDVSMRREKPKSNDDDQQQWLKFEASGRFDSIEARAQPGKTSNSRSDNQTDNGDNHSLMMENGGLSPIVSMIMSETRNLVGVMQREINLLIDGDTESIELNNTYNSCASELAHHHSIVVDVDRQATIKSEDESTYPRSRTSHRRSTSLSSGPNISSISDDEAEAKGRLAAQQFEIGWCDFTYTVEPGFFENPKWGKINSLFHKEPRLIIKGISGGLCSGQMVALMGPSGAGKTCLLECISGVRKDGLGGHIWLRGRNKVKLAIVPQYDYFLPQFTVREIILYGSRLKNPIGYNHEEAVDIVIKQLGLGICEHNNIQRCSGGQQKRVAIAQELVSRPNVLILDEPTSGLDSSCCYQTMKVMRDVLNVSAETDEPMAIVTTIHQPSAKVFKLFDLVYLLGKSGYTAYYGPPDELLTTITRVTGFECPQYSNPADFMIELVALDYGEECASKLIEHEKVRAAQYVLEHPVPGNGDAAQSQHQASPNSVLLPLGQAASINHINHPIFSHIWLHSQRSFLQSVRDPILNNLRAIIHLLFAAILTLLYGGNSGEPKGCPPVIGLPSQITDPDRENLVDLADNVSYLSMSMMMITYLSMMATVLTFPLDIKTISKEYRNGWYGTTAYFLGKSFSDIPFVTIYPILYCTFVWYATGQDTDDFWRFLSFVALMVMNALSSQNFGLILGAIFMNSVPAATFLGPVLTIPWYLFTGFTKRIYRLQEPLRTASQGLFTRHVFEGILDAVYGHDKCDCNRFLELYQKLRQDELTRLAEIASAETLSSMEYYDTLLDTSTIQVIKSQSNSPPHSSVLQNNFASSLSTRASSFFTFGLDFEPSCPKNYKAFIIQEFDLSDDSLWKGLTISMGMFFITRLVTFFIVSYKIRTKQ